MRKNTKKWRPITLLCLLLLSMTAQSSPVFDNERSNSLWLDSKAYHYGNVEWKMKKANTVNDVVEEISRVGYNTQDWIDAVVPGTVLTSLVYNKQLPDPYYADNNAIEKNLIPDISKVGRDYYTYWFRCEFDLPASFKDKTIWLQPDGINYKAEIWVNGNLVSSMIGMFKNDFINISSFVTAGKKNAIAILVKPVDVPGTTAPKTWGATGEFHNGGNGDIGWNVTQLMTVGWDFTFHDGVRDRNTGIWRGISIYATGKLALRHPFVQSAFRNGDYKKAFESVSVEVHNPNNNSYKCKVIGEIEGEGISFSKNVNLRRGETAEVSFSYKDFPELIINEPKLWWPINKGEQHLYKLKLRLEVNGKVSDSLTTNFGIREITVSRNTPDKSKLFYVNGKPLFVRGSNWIPEAMLRTSDKRMEAELKYTAQSGINLLRLWGGGIVESKKFYDLCDKYGILVWQEFWMTGDTRHPHDQSLYLSNVESAVKTIRNNASLAFYVSSNESTEVTGAEELIHRLDATRPYQMQSETDGVHDGSPYKQVNPMRHYENTASDRGSRIDGFNPEYGAPTLPVYESLKEMMPTEDLWPINKKVWDYMDGNGFHLMTSLYDDLIKQYGTPSSIQDYAMKGQLVGAMNSKSIWECWNKNKLNYGDRFCSGLLFWYHNSPNPQVCARMWDWSLEPTASLYHTMHSLEPIHAQFDYLTNTVSVINDYSYALNDLTLETRIYTIDSKLVSKERINVSVPADGVANNVATLQFPQDISQVHFVYLSLQDKAGKTLSENFYWRSNDAYKGKKTLTGPCTSGFETLSDMPKVALKINVDTKQSDNNKKLIVTLKNQSKKISFFNQLQLLDLNSSPVRPAFYSDNFVTLLPGQRKQIEIEFDKAEHEAASNLVISGWNAEKQTFKIK